MLNLSSKARLYVNLLPYVNMIFSILFFLFWVQNPCCNDFKYRSVNRKDVSIANTDFFEKKQFSLPPLQFSIACFRFT